jgi:hypothetical protein
MQNKQTDLNLETKQKKIAIIVRDLEGAQAIEDYIQVSWRNRDSHNEIMNSTLLRNFSQKFFGNIFSDTKFELSNEEMNKLDTPEKQEEWDEIINDFESLFQTTDAGDDETVEILLELKIDFRSAQGHPLNMTRYLKRQAEAAAKRIVGQLPEQETLRTDMWESKLLADKKLFEHSKQKAK